MGMGMGSNKKAMTRIATALEEHCGFDLGNSKEFKDPNEFAMLVECAARNHGPLPKKRRKMDRLQLSHSRRRSSRPSDDEIVAAFMKTGGADDDAVAAAFAKMAQS